MTDAEKCVQGSLTKVNKVTKVKLKKKLILLDYFDIEVTHCVYNIKP